MMNVSRVRHVFQFIGLVFTLNTSSALEVNLAHDYYEIAPTSVEDLTATLIAAGDHNPENVHQSIVSYYEASTMILAMDVRYAGGHCEAKQFELLLNGKMMLPRLKKGHYGNELISRFTQELAMLYAHEKEHERLWKNALELYESEIKHMKIADDAECTALIDEINQKMQRTLVDINAQNMAFDCDSYGRDMGFGICKES